MADFGFATEYDEHKKLKIVCGTPLFMAPELVKKESYDSKVDIWACGVVVYLLVTGKTPFMGTSKN